MLGEVRFRSIGAHPQFRTEARLRQLTEAVLGLCDSEKYRTAAVSAVCSGRHVVYIPADLTEGELDSLVRQDLSPLSYGNPTSGEPTYADWELALLGRNEDGKLHTGGFLVIDVIARIIIDLVDREGKARLHTPLVCFATAEKVVV